MKNSLLNIAIDGHSSCGKSSIAKDVSKKFKMKYVDSGAMYRAVTLFCLQNNLINGELIDHQKILKNLNKINISFNYDTKSEILLNGLNVENLIRDNDVSNYVSKISQIEQVRSKLISFQKEICLQKNVVMDGRDIGTVVFTDAELKIFMTSSAETRAQRRFDELIQKGEKVSYKEVYTNVVERDRVDTTRKDSPLVKAEGAIEIDNSELSKEKQFEIILKLVEEKLRDI